MSKKKPPAAPLPPPVAFHTPFAGLEALREGLPSGAPTAAAHRAAPRTRAAPARAVVRLERKGRRGKEVTVVEQLALSAEERLVWLSEMQRSLGCGGGDEEGALVLQGDQRRRVVAYLRERGVGRVSVS